MDDGKNIKTLLKKGLRVFSFIGEAGCGKSELTLSFALKIRELTGKKVHVFDMDQTKPILRIRNALREIGDQDIVLHTGLNFLDIPRVPLGIESLIRDKDSFIVFDLGGNLAGAINLGQYAGLLDRDDAVTFMVINCFRPFSCDRVNLRKNIQKYSAVIGKEITNIISNPNFGRDTTEQDVVCGNERLEGILAESGYAVNFVSVEYGKQEEKMEAIKDKLIYLSPRIHFDWRKDWKEMKKILILNNICKGCSLCIRVCPQKIIELGKEINESGTQYITLKNADKCTGCGLCAIMCPDCAIEVYEDQR
jgi:NAD-dependent dihydropyrimidine dehydrogenase PreA subunit/energy-coupling factor transporter ATP-binding protein EcfA2